MKRKQQSLCWRGDRKKFKCGGDGDDDDDGGGGGGDGDAADDDDAGGGDGGGGGNEQVSNLFLRANQPSSEALSHQNPTTPNLCQKQISSILKVSNTERRKQESVEHLTLLLSRLNCSTLTMIGCTVL